MEYNNFDKMDLKKMIPALWAHIDYNKKKQLIFLLILMIIVSFAEMIGIGLIVPFLSVIIEPQKFYESEFFSYFRTWFGFSNSEQIVFPFTILFIIITLFSGILRLALLWTNIRFSYNIGADLSVKIYRKTLYQKYEVHVSRNTSEVIDVLASKTDNIVHSVVLPILNIISGSLMIIAITLALILIDPLIAFLSIIIVLIIYSLVAIFTRYRLSSWSETSALESRRKIKLLQEGLGSIRDILIDRSHEKFIKAFQKTDKRLRLASANIIFIAQSPRFSVEALGISLVALIAYLVSLQTNISAIIPVFGALALAAQRLLPIFQQNFYAWANIQGSKSSLLDVLKLLQQKIDIQNDDTKIEKINFTREIFINNVTFKYTESGPPVIKNAEIRISKGSKIGITGSSGSGKSTFVDIAMGLLKPTEGNIIIDNKDINKFNLFSWQSHISHVPQSIFLLDGSIEENIALGVAKENIDQELIKSVSNHAEIADFIDSLPNKYQTIIGERGSKLSGGQRQRIGIARALYKQADIIFFDEATNALDKKTENSILDTIYALDQKLTIIIVSHNVETLNKCDKIIEIENGSIKK